MVRRSTSFATVASLALFSFCFACDSEKEAAGDSAPTKAAESGAASAPADVTATPATGGGNTYSKEARKKKCDAFTREFAAGVFEFPVDRLKPEDPNRKKRCRFSWNHEGKSFYAGIEGLGVKKDEKRAKMWFKNQTATKTQAEVEADGREVAKAVDESKDEKLKDPQGKAVAKTTIGVMTQMTTEGVSWEDVPGLGDEARVNNQNGMVRIRDGNALIVVSAFLVPEDSPYTGPPTDISAITVHNRKWVEATIEERKAASIKLARAYFPEIQKLAD
jgi:hypothetical protein